MRPLFLASFFAAMAFAPFFALAHEEDELATDEHIIHMTAEGFEPQEFTIKQGETVLFENVEERLRWPASNIHPTHTAYPGSDIEKCDSEERDHIFDACRGLQTGDVFRFTFEEPGEWRFHDHNYPEFGGRIMVEKVEGYEQAEEGRSWDIAGFIAALWSDIKVFFDRAWYALFPDTLEEDLAGISLIDVAEARGGELSKWLELLGPTAFMKRIHAESYAGGSYVRECHTAAHNVGRRSYELFGSDIFQLCSAECHSGCYHGGTEAYFSEHGTTNLTEDLNVICDASLNNFFSHQCLHGIGHGLMAWSTYDLPKALSDCEMLESGEYSCYTGVFMENIVGGLAAEQGHFTEYLSDDPHFPCNAVEERYKSSCYFLQTSRMIQLYGGDFGKVARACGQAGDYRQSCFESMGRDAGGFNPGNPRGAIAACETVPESEARGWCLSGAVQDTLWDPSGADTALSFCALLDQQYKDTCYRVIFERATQVFVSEADIRNFCAHAEQPYRGLCPVQ